MKITVFTPTYNRGYCLTRLFESLVKQTYQNFEWVIVDDGSTDNTKDLVESFQEKSVFFPIIYKKTENGGKHRAINRGMELVNGEMILLMDSDDWLRKDALECVVKIDESISEDSKYKYAGIQGLCVHPDGEVVGKTFDGSYVDCTAIECRNYNIYGDKAEIYYTNVLKKYPFPEIEGEKFVTERLVWNKIAKDGYLIRYFNEGIYFCEYLEDGLSHGGNLLYAENPKQWAMAIRQDYDFGVMNAYNTSIQVYIYYLYEKGTITVRHMADNLGMSVFVLYGSIVLQKIMDTMRYILHKKNTISRTTKIDMGKNS
ncbi:glycosyltransferase family 2 protein [Faecalicatena sp. Marseille-Q4148]|nr:glycosyltransferase family 2 protein [Faecalicatena sp. Marseille-Q4148]